MTLTKRLTKGSKLTHAEMDGNLDHLGLAENHSFTASGSGATTRTTQNKLRDIVSVKDFGAVGDADPTTGAGTDDTTAIQAAINSTGATGDRQLTVYFPPGTYRFTTLTVHEGVELRGAGTWKTKLHSVSASTAITFSSGGTFDFPPIVSDMAIHQSGAACIDTGSVSGGIIRDCWFSGTTGVQIPGTADIQISRCYFDGTTNGIAFTAPSEANNVEINSNHFTGNAFGITLKNVRDVRIVGNAFRGDNSHSIHILFSSSGTCTDVLVAANTFYTASGSPQVGAAGSLMVKLDSVVDCLAIDGNNFDGCLGEAIFCEAGTATNISICNNQFKNIGGDVISFTNTGNGVSIRNNNFNSGISDKAVKFNVGTDGNIEIQGNRVRSANTALTASFDGAAFDINQATLAVLSDNVLTSTTMVYGILIRSGVAKAIINNNHVQGATTSNYSINVNPEKTLSAQSFYGNNVSYFNAAPSTGTWVRGDIVWNIEPSAAGTPGWVCTASGSPGTWKAMANLAS